MSLPPRRQRRESSQRQDPTSSFEYPASNAMMYGTSGGFSGGGGVGDTPPLPSGRRQRLGSHNDYSTPDMYPAARTGRVVSDTEVMRHQFGSMSNSRSDELPSAWNILDRTLKQSNPAAIRFQPSSTTMVVANRPIPTSFLQNHVANNNNGLGRGSRSGGTPLYPSLGQPSEFQRSTTSPYQQQSPDEVYYFEIEILPSPNISSSIDISVGLVGDASNTCGGVPGDVPNSVGWGPGGLKLNGRVYDTSGVQLSVGDILGCGVEVTGRHRVFFTHNGKLAIPPTNSTSFSSVMETHCLPAVGCRTGNGYGIRANFGLESSSAFAWSGSEGLDIVPLRAWSSLSVSRLNTNNNMDNMNSFAGSPNITTRSTPRLDGPGSSGVLFGSPSMVSPSDTHRLSSSLSNIPGPPKSYGSPQTPTIFGTASKKSLEDDDPSHTNATSAHFNLGLKPPPPNSRQNSNMSQSPRSGQIYPMERVPSSQMESSGHTRPPQGTQSASSTSSSWRYTSGGGAGSASSDNFSRRPPQQSSSGSSRLMPSSSGSDSEWRSTTRIDSRSEQVPVLPRGGPRQRGSTGADSLPLDLFQQRSQLEPNAVESQVRHRKRSPPRPVDGVRVGAIAAGASDAKHKSDDVSGDVAGVAKENYKTLLTVVKEKNVDIMYVRELIELCKMDLEKVQQKVNTALEENGAVDNLEELFALNDKICSAIDAGKKVVKQAKQQQQQQRSKSHESPSINLLVDNKDVFSLICMLRAQHERRLAAALALMKFARESHTLRDEIRSSGGMHSFLTLFRTSGATRELQIVASLAVAYILPSFVASSQTSSSLGMKIAECLRFLVTSGDVSPQGVIITREEMCKASVTGVGFFWIHAIQPLLLSEAMPVTRRSSTRSKMNSRKSKLIRGRPEAAMMETRQDDDELQLLTEMTVTLIAHIAKLSQSNTISINMGYNLVEQVCEVDIARPVAVREGLLRVLVEWIRSKDPERVRPAASALRYLISIDDKYMAGWIHSQVVNEGAVREIVQLLTENLGHDVRVAVAEMLAALCVAPHTRASVVEARCVNFLVALLFDHNDPAAEMMVQYAGRALLLLAAGAMNGSNSFSLGSVDVEPGNAENQESVLSEIIESWAHGSFVQIALEHTGALRSISIEALRVLSEDMDQKRQTRLQLCGVGAARALGKALKDDIGDMEKILKSDNGEDIFVGVGDSVNKTIKEVYEALCALANMFEPPKKSSKARFSHTSKHFSNPRESLIKGCVDTAESGGLESLIRISTLPLSEFSPAEVSMNDVDRFDLLAEACRLLASLSPLLLSDTAASKGCAVWASKVFEALDGILKQIAGADEYDAEASGELNIDALRGLGALARYEPLKIRIVDKTLSNLLHLKNISGDRTDASNAASQVLLSLGFTEDDIAVQVTGNNPQLLVDWFCLQRSLIIQAMARSELRAILADVWGLPCMDVGSIKALGLVRESSGRSAKSTGNGDDEKTVDSDAGKDLFDNFATDDDSAMLRQSFVRQYRDIYVPSETSRSVEFGSISSIDQRLRSNGEEGLISKHVYPLNEIVTEKEWVLAHQRSLDQTPRNELQYFATECLSDRIDKLLECCFPSKLLRDAVIPMTDFRPDASFDFRALMMPQRRYFSFRREGQLLSRLCEKQAAALDSDDVHWKLGFTNSTFAGEFVESLVQTLYLCPMITGLSFSRNEGWQLMSDSDKDADGDDGSALLANLAGSLPPWVAYLTFDNMLNDRDLRALVAIIETMGKLSGGQDSESGSFSSGSPILGSVGQTQGKFVSFGVSNSPYISKESWFSFFKMLGRDGPSKRVISTSPLTTLKALDLSGNKLGDEACAFVLELAHEKDSGCCLEQIDLSGNRIGRGINVVRVLRAYTEYYRYNQTVGVKMVRKSWKSSLHTMILAENDLFLGQAGLEILALLKHNALFLRHLDLSNNSLEGDTYQLLASSLLKNTSLCHLNLSYNKFSSPLLDLILESLNSPDAESRLSFLRFEGNSPPLSDMQCQSLARFLRKSRKGAIERYLKNRDKNTLGDISEYEATDFDRQGEMDLAEESEAGLFSPRNSFVGELRGVGNLDQEPDNSELTGDNMITVLFSAPLVFAAEDNQLHPFAKLDFDMERELLWQCLKEASRDIKVSFDTAHHSRLLATLTKRCSCLHYSGHGHQSFLPFEDGMGGPNWLNVQDIKELIVRDGNAPFKFVFVSACHSGLAGETFASAGVPHVVCCRQESELKDTAALAFTRQFYLALAVGHTVKESFEQGCKAVRATPNLRDPEQEMEKFVLLPKDGNHDVPVFKAKKVLEWPRQPREKAPSAKSRRRSLVRVRSVMGLGAKSSELSVRNMIQEDPSPTPPQFFMGREVDMYYVLTAVLKLRKRLVSILGETGIGRSSLVCALCHYVNERASTMSEIHRIYFVKPKHGGRNVSCRSLLRQLLDKLEEAEKARRNEVDGDADTEAILDVICKSLKNDKALIVFDRTELLEDTDEAQEFPMILSTLLYETKQVKVILTGKRPLGIPSIGGQVEHPFNLSPLDFENTVRLFANLCPHLHTPSERGLLLQRLVANAQDDEADDSMIERSHKIFDVLGGGVPAKIEKAAYSITTEQLENIRDGGEIQ